MLALACGGGGGKSWPLTARMTERRASPWVPEPQLEKMRSSASDAKLQTRLTPLAFAAASFFAE
jgi:hypothetical protein